MNTTNDWISTVPSHWNRMKLKYLASLKSGNAITSDTIEETGEYPVFGGNGIRGYTSEYTHCGRYVLIGRQGALCGNINYAAGCFWASEHAIVVDIKDRGEIEWLGELLRFMDLNQYSHSAAQPGIAVEVIANLEIPVPPLTEQRAIASYLYKENARLDGLVAAKEQLLAVLAEKRRSLIAHAVLRGVKPAVTLRDSGIPWLGKIPGHWKTARAKWLFRERDERSTTGEEVLLSLRMERGLVPHNEVSEKATRSDELIGYKKIAPNEIVVNRMRAASGLVAVAPQHGLVSPDYAVFQTAPCVDPDYFTYLFKTELLQTIFRSESTGLGTGSSGFLRLYSESFLALWLPLPSLSEQRAIVAHIRNETANLDMMRSATEATIALIKERRSALSAAVITGQMKVI